MHVHRLVHAALGEDERGDHAAAMRGYMDALAAVAEEARGFTSCDHAHAAQLFQLARACLDRAEDALGHIPAPHTHAPAAQQPQQLQEESPTSPLEHEARAWNDALLQRVEGEGGEDAALAVARRVAENLAIARQRVDERPVEHLFLVVHGIGSQGEGESDPEALIRESVSKLRENCATLMSTTFAHTGLDASAVAFEYVEWHSKLHRVPEMARRVENITLPKLPKLRHFCNDTISDVLFYLSPAFSHVIRSTVIAQLNERYKQFVDEHPRFSGRVSIIGHSLGSVVSFDVLHQHYVDAPVLSFHPEHLVCLGSPLAVFLTVRRGEHQVSELLRHMRITSIAHPYDPVVYRIEPIVFARMSRVPMCQLRHWRTGDKRLHIKLAHTPSSEYDRDCEREVLAAWSVAHRIDHVLQQRFTHQISEYLYSVQSHLVYWSLKDVGLFLLDSVLPAAP